MSEEAILLYTTWPGHKAAEKASKALLEKKLIACANIYPEIKSIYNWEGKTESSYEVVVIFKTLKDQVEAIRETILSLHEYDCPCILELPVSGGHPEFLSWLKGQVRP